VQACITAVWTYYRRSGERRKVGRGREKRAGEKK